MEKAESSAAAAGRPLTRTQQRVMLGGLFGGHALTHFYQQGFVVLLPRLYQEMKLLPLEGGLVEGVRWLSVGTGSILTGFFSDMFRHRRRLFLLLSLLLIGVGYFLVSLATNYGVLLLAVALAAGGASIWHPPALGMLAQRFPQQRGLFMSLHRSLGSVGDVAGPVLIGLLLVVITWRQVLQVTLPVTLLLAFLIWTMLRQVAEPRADVSAGSSARVQLRSLRRVFQGWNMVNIQSASALHGMAMRAVFISLPLYLAQTLQMGSVGIGFHIGLLTFLAIGTGPLMGALSDRVGRKPVIMVALLVCSAFALLMKLAGAGFALTLAVAGMGIFLFPVTSLMQAAAIDIAEGMRLEGTLVGLLFGTNSIFGAFSPVIVGWLAGLFTQGGVPRWDVGFYFAAALFLASALLFLRLPVTGGRGRKPVPAS